MTPSAVTARDLRIVHRASDRPALDGISFDLEPGRVLLVVGPSGSGKSTLALTIAGLIPHEIPASMTGRLELDGRDIRDVGPVAIGAGVGLVMQDPASQLVMERVEDDVAFGLENRAWPIASMRERVPEALGEAGLAGMDRGRSRRLSGGQQQRLAMAGAMAPRPGLLILDEPTANLDPGGADALMGLLGRLRHARSTTVVLIDHRVEQSWPLADLVLALDTDGRLLDVGSPTDVAARSGRRMAEAGIWLPASLGPDDPGGGQRRIARPSVTGSGKPVVSASGVRFGYDRNVPVIRDISLDAFAGERIALVGPNGSGKSTLGRLLVGLLRPDHGTVTLLGSDPSRLPAADLARRAGYVFQEPERQFLTERVGDEVALGLTRVEAARTADLMEKLGLPLGRFAERSPYRLSGGEQRRLSLASVLIRRPRVLVLDEPTFGQDRHGYEGLLAILAEHLDNGVCLVTATHDERFVSDMADRIVQVDDGWVIEDERVEVESA